MRIKLDNDRPWIWQWSKGQRLILEGIPAGTQIDFAHCHDGEALSVTAYEEDGIIYADIPNVLLQEAQHLHVYVYITDGDRGETTCHDSIRVIERPKPADYVCTETEVLTWHALDERIKALEDGGGGSSDSSPNGGGMTTAEKSLILSLFEHAAYTADMSATIEQLENLWSGGTVEPGPEEPDEPVDPDVWYEHFSENNLVDTAGQNSFTTVDGVRYYQYYAGESNFEYPMTNQQAGEVKVTMRAVPKNATSLDAGIWLYYDDGTSYKINVITGGSSNGTITYTTPADKTLTKLTGNYDMEGWVLLDMSVMSIRAKYPPAVPDDPGGDEPTDETGHVIVTGATATDDGNGNVTVIGLTATDDGNGNITVTTT